jgi:hypothetical protein
MWSLIALFAVLTVVTACASSHEPHRHDDDKTRSHADDAHRDMEREEQSQK